MCSVCYLAKVFAESLRDQFLKDYNTLDPEDLVHKFEPEEVLCAQLAGLCHDLGRQIVIILLCNRVKLYLLRLSLYYRTRSFFTHV